MSGFRVSRLLKFDDRYKQTRIVMMTANDLTAVKEMYEAVVRITLSENLLNLVN